MILSCSLTLNIVFIFVIYHLAFTRKMERKLFEMRNAINYKTINKLIGDKLELETRVK